MISFIISTFAILFRGKRKKYQKKMKKDIHPEYKEVVFHDTSSDFKFMTKSTMGSDETIKWEDGNEYPLLKVEVSSASHPFYTGKKLFVDTAGRVEKFNRRYKKK
ncbi:MAG: large subunit ribosomal protein L31 [Cyclobacteriaceae bacterium]